MNKLRTIFVVLTISLLVPLFVSAQQKQERTQNDLAVEIAFNVKEEDKKPFYVPVTQAGASEGLFAIVQSPSNSQAPRFKVTSKIEGDAVRVEVFALLGNMNKMSSVKEIEEMPQEAVASFLARQGETIQVSEVTRFGVESLEIKVVSAKPLNLNLPSATKTRQSKGN
jgi:hypothetical protein